MTKTRTKRIIAMAGLLLALVALTLLDLVPGVAAQAAQAGTGGIGYYVRAVLPENQTDSSLTYFDLRMQPGQTQTLEVEVVNEGDEAIVVDIAVISASTNRNGIIDYKTPDIRDKTLRHPFSGLARIESGSLSIPAGGAVPAKITLTMPQESYDGVVLGGLVFTRRPGHDEAGGEGMTLQNVYSYVLGVKLTETDAAVQPDFELESVAAGTVNYQPAMVHTIRNRAAAIAKGVRLSLTVTDGAGNTVAQIERAGIDMAPNSTMPLAVMPGEGLPAPEDSQSSAQAPGQLAPGSYTSQAVIEHDGQQWTFEQKFTVGSVEAEQANNALPVAAAGPGRTSPTIVLLIALAAAILLALLVVIILLLRRRKEQRDQGNHA